MAQLDPEDIEILRTAVMMLQGLERGGVARDVMKVIEKAEHGQHPDT